MEMCTGARAHVRVRVRVRVRVCVCVLVMECERTCMWENEYLWEFACMKAWVHMQ